LLLTLGRSPGRRSVSLAACGVARRCWRCPWQRPSPARRFPRTRRPTPGHPIAERGFIELETRYAHLERQVAELSEVVFEQQRSLDALRAQLRMMNARLEQPGDAPANEEPPHY
jgi:uncharacterized coiled-coil protein SlyX